MTTLSNTWDTHTITVTGSGTLQAIQYDLINFVAHNPPDKIKVMMQYHDKESLHITFGSISIYIGTIQR